MCLIIEKPAGKTIPVKYLEHAAKQNSDGCGLAVYDGINKVRLIKGVSDPLRIASRANSEFKDCLVYVHLRWTTHGANTFENTHPVAVPNAPFVLMHNGVLSGYGESAWNGKHWLGTTETASSDTREFAETVLSPLMQEFAGLWTNAAFHKLLSDAIGSDKMVLLGQSQAFVINRGLGHDEDGIWYSNTYSLPSKPAPVNLYTPSQKILTLPNGRGSNRNTPKYSKSKKLRKAEMRKCSYRDVCECSGCCYMENSEEYVAKHEGCSVNHNEVMRDIVDFGTYGMVYSGDDETSEIEVVSEEALQQMLANDNYRFD